MLASIQRFAASTLFDRSIIGLILLTAFIIALEAFPEIMTPDLERVFLLLHKLVLAARIRNHGTISRTDGMFLISV